MSKSLLKRIRVCIEKKRSPRTKDLLQVIHLVGALDKDVARPSMNVLSFSYKAETKNFLFDLEEELDYGYHSTTWEQALTGVDLRILNNEAKEIVRIECLPYDLVRGLPEDDLESNPSLDAAIAELLEIYLERADEWEALTADMGELEGIQRKIYRDQFDKREHYQSLWSA